MDRCRNLALASLLLMLASSGCFLGPRGGTTISSYQRARVPPGQIRSAEVHARNNERKAAHDAAKGQPKGKKR